MQKRKIRGLDQKETEGRGKAQAMEKPGQRSYSMKSGKASSRSRRRGGRAGGRRRRQRDKRGTAYKIADLLPDETIKKLKEMGR